MQWSLFGWLYIFLPLLAFYTLARYGGYTGKRLLVIAVAVSFVAYLLLRNFEFFVFSFALLFSGYVLFLSAERHDTPAISGLKGSLCSGRQLGRYLHRAVYRLGCIGIWTVFEFSG